MSNDYPNAPGHRSVDTSIDAAEHIAPAVPILSAKVLTAVINAGERGITVVEMANAHNLDRMGIQPRFSELRALGKIVDSGMRRKNPSGVSAIVWTLPEFVLPAPARAA